VETGSVAWDAGIISNGFYTALVLAAVIYLSDRWGLARLRFAPRLAIAVGIHSTFISAGRTQDNPDGGDVKIPSNG